MNSTKVERSLKLRQEDFRSKPYNIIGNVQQEEGTWMKCFDNQLADLDVKVSDNISITHTEKKQIASNVNEVDRVNEKLRVNMDYMAKKNLSHETSARYKHNPKDN